MGRSRGVIVLDSIGWCSMIDTNFSIGHWPFRNVPGDNLSVLTAHLLKNGITQAWTGSLEGLFDRDIGGVNLRLERACRTASAGLLLPFGTVNPALPDWEDDLRRCAEVHKFVGIRLHPGFHGYDLNQPAFARLLAQAAERKLIVQLVVTMEDERTQNPVFRVPFVDLSPLPKLLDTTPDLRFVVLNAFRKTTIEEAAKLASRGQVYFDIGMLEGVDRLATLVDRVTPDRILFGSHFPLFYVESAILKLRESQVPPQLLEPIKSSNASRLLAR